MNFRLTALAMAAMIASACSTIRATESPAIYDTVSKQLVEVRYTSICCGYAGHWAPLGHAYFGGISVDAKPLTREQEEAIEASLSACIAKLKQEYMGVNAAMATSQLIECMRTQGWSHGFGEFLTTS